MKGKRQIRCHELVPYPRKTIDDQNKIFGLLGLEQNGSEVLYE